MLAKHNKLPDETFLIIEHFVCCLYGKHNMHNVDTGPYVIFQHRYAPRKQSDLLGKIKGVNPSSMPPCWSVLTKKIKRANYVVSPWKNAVRPDSASLCGQTNRHGWIPVDGKYTIDWFDGEQMPHNISWSSVKIIQSWHQKFTKVIKCSMESSCTVLMNWTLTMLIGDKHTTQDGQACWLIFLPQDTPMDSLWNRSLANTIIPTNAH